MKITFISQYSHPGQKPQTVQFSSELKEWEEDGFRVLEFTEPSQNVITRIEVGKKAANIFSGSSTLNLELGQSVEIEYSTGEGSIFLDSFLKEIKNTPQNVFLSYTLSQNNGVIGEYQITLKIGSVSPN